MFFLKGSFLNSFLSGQNRVPQVHVPREQERLHTLLSRVNFRNSVSVEKTNGHKIAGFAASEDLVSFVVGFSRRSSYILLK